MAFAEQTDVSDRGLASESHLEIVVELETVRRAAHVSVSHRPGTAPLVALPDRPLDRGWDVAIIFAGSIRLRARPVSQRLALSISLEDELEGLAYDLFEVPVGALVGERGTHLLQLGHEVCRDRDVEAAQLRRERLDDLGRRRRRFGSRGNRGDNDERSGRHWQCPNDVSRHWLGLVLDGEELGFLLRLALGPADHLGMVLFGQHLSQLDQSADRQPAFCESIHDRRKPRDETSHFRSPERRGLRKPELPNAIIEERSVSELAIELPLGEAGQLDDELDYQVPLAPNQLGEAAVEIARGVQFHSNRLTRVSALSCEATRRPWPADPAMP